VLEFHPGRDALLRVHYTDKKDPLLRVHHTDKKDPLLRVHQNRQYERSETRSKK